MSVKRPGLPFESLPLAQRVDEGAAAASNNNLDKLPDEILDHIFSFLPKEACKAMSLVDKRMNHVMAEHYTNRAILALNDGFNVQIPKTLQFLTENGLNCPSLFDPTKRITFKLQVMQIKDHRLLKTIHEESVQYLHSLKEDKSLKALSQVDRAIFPPLPQITLHAIFYTDINTGLTHSAAESVHGALPLCFDINTKSWMI